jgi:hypothetical protein
VTMVGLYWDTWDPAYTRSAPDGGGEAPEQESTASVDPEVELPAVAWAPCDPGDVEAPVVVLFVDGVLRNDARGWIVDRQGDSHPALAASYAAGVVRCDLANGLAEAVTAQVRRAVLTSAPADQVTVAGSGAASYRPEHVEVGSHQQLDGHLRVLMSKLEVRVSDSARAARPQTSTVDDDLLVVDGRLRGRRSLPRTIGYVKTQGTRYLPAELVKVVTGLPAGTRTPVFRLSTLYSWYLRLPGPARGPWAGIVRVECSGDLSSNEAIELAEVSTATLPRFASSPYKDPRAPQNLIPIAGLERQLRALLGDARLLHRALARYAR